MSNLPPAGQDDATSPQQAPKGALLAIFLIVFTDLLGFGIIIPLLAFYVPDYQNRPMHVTGLFSIFSICQFIAAPILGALSDRYGRRPVLVLSQIGSALGYVLLGLATDIRWSNPDWVLRIVYLSRVIDGISGGNISTAQAYISDVTSAENRAKGMGLLGAAFGIGFSAGPALGALLGFHPSLPAYAAALFSFAAAAFTYLYLPESNRRKPLEVESWLHPSVFLPVLRKPAVAQLLAISFLAMASFVMMESTIAIYLDAHMGYKQRQVGWFFAYAGINIAIVQGGLIGRLTRRFGEWPLAIGGLALVGVGMAAFIGLAWWPALALLALAGLINSWGRSFQQPTITSLLSKFTDPREQGVTFGLYHGLSSLARVAGPVAAGFTYPYWRNTGPYVVAGVLVLLAAAWLGAMRVKYGGGENVKLEDLKT